MLATPRFDDAQSAPRRLMTEARLTVELGALRANYRFVAAAARSHAPANGLPAAVVKADAYGLGAPAVANALGEAGCRDFFVANLREGVVLRQALRAAPADARVFVFSGPLSAAAAAEMAAEGLVPVLNNAAQVRFWRRFAHLPAALQVDTGMHRLGFHDVELDAAMFAGMNLCLLVSHLANADVPADAMNERQLERFRAVAAAFPDVPTSMGNSAGALGGTLAGMARPGIALYGGNPFSRRPNAMRVVATLEARVVGLRDVSADTAVGYGGAFTTRRATRLAVLGIGYADGVPRRLARAPQAAVAFNGKRLPLCGRVSMDLTQVDATAVADDLALGDWVELFGPAIPVDEFATWSETISYEALTAIGARVRRCYIDADARSMVS